MARFYLHVRHGNTWLEDLNGWEVPDLPTAIAEAGMTAHKMLAGFGRIRQGRTGWIFEVCDDRGTVLAHVP